MVCRANVNHDDGGSISFCIQLSDVNLYKQQVNYQIERHGGLTKEAGAYLKDYSEKQYQGALSVKSDQLNKKVNFGDVVDYQVVANLKIILLICLT